MEVSENAKKIVASAVGGLGVLGSLISVGFKANSQVNAQEVIENVAGSLQQSSTDLLALAQQLEGEEATKVQGMGDYIGQMANKIA
ncbi:MAG: hypothetical protein GW795_08030, partial [Cyanobacteria bacterium]|nr:hypothetical protein [Cyanobacteria bacterium CG_2015-04_32_10]